MNLIHKYLPLIPFLFVSFFAKADIKENDKTREFSIKAISDINTFNYKQTDKELEKQKVYFTNEGWNKYLSTLKESKVLNTLSVYEMSMSPMHIGSLKIISEQDSPIEVFAPLKLKYKSDNKNEKVTIVTRGVVFMKLINDNESFKINSYHYIETEN